MIFCVDIHCIWYWHRLGRHEKALLFRVRYARQIARNSSLHVSMASLFLAAWLCPLRILYHNRIESLPQGKLKAQRNPMIRQIYLAALIIPQIRGNAR